MLIIMVGRTGYVNLSAAEVEFSEVMAKTICPLEDGYWNPINNSNGS